MISDTPEFVDPFPGVIYLTGKQASVYLAMRWGIDSYANGAFRALIFRLGIKPNFGTRNTTFWSRDKLNGIDKPDRGKPRIRRKKILHS